MNVICKATLRHRRILSSIFAGIMLIEAAPVALAQQSARASTASEPVSVLDMYAGEVRMVNVPGTIKRIAVGNGKLLNANVTDGKLLLLAEGSGITSLVVWNEKGLALQTTVRVAKGDVHITAAHLRQVLRDEPGVQVREVGPNIVLSGMVHKDSAAVIKTATADLNNVIDTTRVDEGDTLKKTVHFKVQILELTRTAQQDLGIAWDKQINGPQIGGAVSWVDGAAKTAVSGTNYFLAGIASNITSKINMAINDGNAYILAAPELNTKSGGVASFLAGGQVPIPRAGALGTTDLEYKDYGIKLNIHPVVDVNNVISAKVETEISQIDPSVSYQGFPGFLMRRSNSDISLRAGETIAISGLISADSLDSLNGLPYLSKLPVIGKLFGSDSFRAKKSDLVIFVTPVISDPMMDDNVRLLDRADAIDKGFVEKFGSPEALVPNTEKARAIAERQTIAPTPAQAVAPLRVEPVLRPVPSKNGPAQPSVAVTPAAPDQTPGDEPAQSRRATASDAKLSQPGSATQGDVPGSTNAPAIADALRTLSARTPTAGNDTPAIIIAPGGKTTSGQVDTLGGDAR